MTILGVFRNRDIIDQTETCPNCGNDFYVKYGCNNCGYGIFDKNQEYDIYNFISENSKKIEKIIFKNEINYEFLLGNISSYKISLFNGKIKSIKIKINGKKYIIFLEEYDFKTKTIKCRNFNEPDYIEQNISSINIENLKIIIHEKLKVGSKYVYIDKYLYKQLNDFTLRLLKNYHKNK